MRRLALFLAVCMSFVLPANAQVVITEIAWMGNTNSTSDEWIEIHNISGADVDLTGWTLAATDGTPSISLSGTIPAHGYFLLERTDDTTAPGVTADLIYTGSLENGGEILELRDNINGLVDWVDAWHAGDNSSKAAMHRLDSLVAGTSASNWADADTTYTGGYGTPGESNFGVNINEVAWMGTTNSTNDEWIELHNPTNSTVDLTGWTLAATDGTPSINLSGSIPAGGFYLLERTDDTSVPGVTADLIYTGSLENGGEVLELRDGGNVLMDMVDVWYAGDNSTKASMERVVPSSLGYRAASWQTSAASYAGGYGTPSTGVGGGSGGSPNYTDDWYDVYFSNHVNKNLLTATGPSPASQALINAIDNATTTIEFAIYGVAGADQFRSALVAAQDRGVTVRGVMDNSASGWYPYKDSEALINALDPGTVVLDNDDAIMHNKFVVIDSQHVWTGSGNISDTGIYKDYNANWSIMIDHAALAAEFQVEFNEMYGGTFHAAKVDNTQHTFPTLADGSEIELYFGPSDDAETNAILPAINAATSTLDLRIFYFTAPAVRDAILAADTRGVTVRMIIDASGADSEYSLHEDLRVAGIDVKVENWGGKEHMKALAADNEVVIIGSQNWTASGNTLSDENTLYIKNGVLAQAFTDDFNTNWASIPNTWLSGNPGAESINSTNSTTDFIDNDHDYLTDEGAPETLNTVSSAAGAINVYFNKSALTQYNVGSLANHNVNLEDRLVARINAATSTIDMATYELNLPGIVDALLARAAAGVDVRVVADAKDYDEGESHNYDTFVAVMEKLVRGLDGTVGTLDDVHLLADSPVMALANVTTRTNNGLPASASDLSWETLNVGYGQKTGYVVAYGEKKNATDYYSAGPQQHNKFVIFDGTWVWTGSWNFTMNGLYGDDANRPAGILGGNSNHGIEIHSPGLADIYTDEFEEMYGSTTTTPDPDTAAFHGRKTDNTLHSVNVGGVTVEVYFSAGDDAIGKVTDYITNYADNSAYFCAFTWSDQGMVDALKVKWEGSDQDLTGTLTGFDVQGVFDSLGYNQWWSASVDMEGRTASQSSVNNPNTRWANPAPVVKDDEDEILHHKYMIIDGQSNSDPAVITGSTNWSNNGNNINDENLLIIHSADIADQFTQEYYARYYQGGGSIP